MEADLTMTAAAVTNDAVTNNRAMSRFEMPVDGGLAFASYFRRGDALIITHTETPRHLRGQGLGARLVKGTLDAIRADGLKVVAGCSFVADYLQQHPEYADLQR
jgi:predicted GNAT family acetyltransferase